jgi:hypothetical protein
MHVHGGQQALRATLRALYSAVKNKAVKSEQIATTTA